MDVSNFRVGDYAIHEDPMYGKREVKIEGRIGTSDLYLVSLNDREGGYKQFYVSGTELSPVPDLTPQAPDLTPLQSALQECDAKALTVSMAWNAAFDAVSDFNSTAKTKDMINAFKLAEAEYTKALCQLHIAVKAVLS